jgi:hypothetical protein
MNVHINKINGKKIGYKVRWVEDGNPKESFKKHHKDALALQADIREKFVGDSTESFRKTYLTQSQIKDAEAAVLELDGRLSIREAVRIALEHWVDASNGISIEEARWRFYESLESEGLRPDTINKYKQTASRIAARLEGKQTSDLTYESAKSFMEQFKHPLNFNARRRELSRFTSYIVENGWLPSNPINGIKPKKNDPKQPEIISPEQVEELLKVAATGFPKGAVTYLALSTFAAIRPQEMKRLCEDKNLSKLVNLDTGLITLPANVTKNRRIRNIKIRPALRAFLESYPEPPRLIDSQMKRLKRQLSFTIPHDGLRHTGITGIYMEHRSFGDTALETGNSERIIRDHYLGFWTDIQAEKFWSLKPNKLNNINFLDRAKILARREIFND